MEMKNKKEPRPNKRSYRLSNEENVLIKKLKVKHGYGKTVPTIEMILDLFEKIELLELENYQLKNELKKAEELEKQNKIVNSKLNLNTKLLQKLLSIPDKELEEIRIELIRKNNNK